MFEVLSSVFGSSLNIFRMATEYSCSSSLDIRKTNVGVYSALHLPYLESNIIKEITVSRIKLIFKSQYL